MKFQQNCKINFDKEKITEKKDESQKNDNDYEISIDLSDRYEFLPENFKKLIKKTNMNL